MKNVLVINGSPKGGNSVTLQTVRFLEKKYRQCRFEVLDAAKKIKALEKDFSSVLQAVDKADLVLFSYPVYTFLVPAQLHRVVELLAESGVDFKGKYATQISTSKHFYDTTAHEFMRENLSDMGFNVLEGLSADMEDLLSEKGREEAEKFFAYTLWQMQGRKGPEKSDDKRIVVVTDLAEDDTALKAKIELFISEVAYPVDVINLRTFAFKGGCQGCFNCAASGECIYKDGFTDLLRGNIHKHDAIVYAFRIRNHSMGSLFKTYDDRQFCNGHRTVTMGTPFAYIVEGDMLAEPNLRKVLEARAQVGYNFLAGIACDDAAVRQMASVLGYAMSSKLVLPQNFLGVGGMKIFRDLIYQMRGMMRADHKFFKSHGQYDFPQKKWADSMKMYLVGWLMGNKKLKAKMGGRMDEGMLAPYVKVLDKTE